MLRIQVSSTPERAKNIRQFDVARRESFVVVVNYCHYQSKSKRNERTSATAEATYGEGLRAALAGSPACVFPFVFVSIYVEFELIMKVIDDDDDDERKHSKKAKFASNDGSGHDDQFCPKIVKIGAILGG